METIVQDLKGLVQLLFPLALFLVVVLLRAHFRRSAASQGGEALRIPPDQPRLERVRSAPRSDVSSAEEHPDPPREPKKASREAWPKDLALGHALVEGKPVASDTRRRLRQLLADPGGRRVALLAHEVFCPPEGCGRDDTRGQPR
jgi:type IV secretory pathway VirB10-like protein